MIYFLQLCVEVSRENNIGKSDVEFWKIGFTDHFQDRMNALAQRHKNQEKYIAYLMEGTLSEEKELHRTFAQYRILNEYYADVDRKIMQFLWERQRFIKVYEVENDQWAAVRLGEPTLLNEIWGDLLEPVGAEG